MFNSDYDFQRNFAIIIGINKYDNLQRPLETAVSDAEELARILKHHHEQLAEKYQEQNKYEVRLLTDENATLEKLDQLLENFRNGQIPLDNETVQVDGNDRVIFYFAGHGKATETENGLTGYLLPQDAANDTSTWLPMRKLHDALLKLHCRHMLLILDCCFAGAFRWVTRQRDVELAVPVYQETYDRFIRDPAWQVITSAGYNQKALDSLGFRGRVSGTNHSPFAQALFDALQGKNDPRSQRTADTDNDHILIANELEIYLANNVYTVADKHSHEQTPSLFSLDKHRNGRFFFLLKDFNRDKLKEAPKITPENNPYRGLESYDEEHTKLFYGRENLIRQLKERVIHENKALTVILGVSGSGKSSLMKAGLLPRLRNEHQFTILGPMRVGDSPLTALARAFLPIKDETALQDLATIKNLTQTLKKDSQSWIDTINFRKTNEYNTELCQSIKDLELTNEQVEFLKEWRDINCTKPVSINPWIDTFYKRNNLIERIEKSTKTLASDFKADAKTLIAIIKAWKSKSKTAKLLLAVDQFEELNTLAKSDSNDEDKNDNTEQALFQELLKEAIVHCKNCFDVVITLRSDFEAQFKDGILKNFWDDAKFIIMPMTQNELREAIEKPAAEKEIVFEPPSLVDHLINQVIQMPGALPLLSFALSELYLNYMEENNQFTRDNRALTEDDYKKIGGVFGSVTKRADKEYKDLVQQNQAYEKTVRQVMLRMVAVGDEARRRVLLSELDYPDKAEHQRAKNVIQQFCQARLLVQGKNSEDQPYVEPAHDALIQNWDQLQKWKNEQEENLILQRKLTPVANDWQEVNEREEAKKKQSKVSLKYLLYLLEQLEAIYISKTQHKIRNFKKSRRAKQQSNDSSKNYLWHNDPRLAQLNLFLDSPDNWFNKTEDEFVRESVIHKGRNTYRFWLRVALIGAGLVLLTGWALWEQRQAKIEEMLAWKESAEGNLKSDRDIRAFLDILQAVDISKNPLVRFLPPDTALAEVQETMYKAFYTVKERNRIESDRATFYQVAFNPKTNELVTIGDGDTIRLWDQSGNQVDQFSTGQNRVYSVAFSQDGKQLATGDGNGTVKLWNLKKDGIVDYNSNNTICPIANPTHNSVTNLENTSGANPTTTSGANLSNPSGANLSNPSGANPTNPSGTNPTTTSGANPANISGVVFSHDNKLLATLIEGKDAQNNPTTTVNLWDIKQGKCIPRNIANTPLGQEGQPPNNQQTATRQKNQLIVPTPNNQPTVPIKDIAFSPNENLLATVAQNNTIRLWDISGKKLGEFPTDQRNVYSLAFSPDGKLATSGDEGTVKLWTIQNNGIKATLSSQVPEEIETEQTLLYDIAFSEGNKWLATIGEDSAIRLHDRSWQSHIKRIFNQHIVEIPPIEASNQTITATSAVFSPDGKTMATIAGDNTVKLWNNLGQQIARFKTDAGEVKSIAFSPEGNLWLTSGENREISIRDTSGEEIDKISLQDIPACDQEDDTIESANNTDENTESSSNPITQVVFAFIDTNDGTEPDEQDWAYNQLEDDEYAGMMTIFEDGTTRFLSFQGKDLQDASLSEYCTEPFPQNLGLIKGLASSPDGEHLVTVGKDGDTINLWDEASDQFQQLPIPIKENETFTSVAFSPDEKRLAIASASAAEDETGLVRIWDITQNAIVEQFDTGQGELYSVAFSPLDSRQLVTGGGDGTVKVWDISSNRPAQFSTTQGTIQRMEFSPNQKLLATINKNNQLNLWNVREDGTVSLNPAAEIFQQQHGGVKNVTFSPDSKTLILVGKDDTIKLWNISTNKINSFATQQQQIQSLVASPNKRKLATIGNNGRLKLWQIQDGNLSPIDISKSQLSRSQINSLAFSPNGKQLATAQGNILKWIGSFAWRRSSSR